MFAFPVGCLQVELRTDELWAAYATWRRLQPACGSACECWRRSWGSAQAPKAQFQCLFRAPANGNARRWLLARPCCGRLVAGVAGVWAVARWRFSVVSCASASFPLLVVYIVIGSLRALLRGRILAACMPVAWCAALAGCGFFRSAFGNSAAPDICVYATKMSLCRGCFGAEARCRCKTCCLAMRNGTFWKLKRAVSAGKTARSVIRWLPGCCAARPGWRFLTLIC